MPIPDFNPDTSLYPKAPEASKSSNDPLHAAIQAAQMRNEINNINKIRGGMPATQDSLNQLGAGQDYSD